MTIGKIFTARRDRCSDLKTSARASNALAYSQDRGPYTSNASATNCSWMSSRVDDFGCDRSDHDDLESSDDTTDDGARGHFRRARVFSHFGESTPIRGCRWCRHQPLLYAVDPIVTTILPVRSSTTVHDSRRSWPCVRFSSELLDRNYQGVATLNSTLARLELGDRCEDHPQSR